LGGLKLISSFVQQALKEGLVEVALVEKYK